MPIDADVAASVLIDAWRHLFSSMQDSGYNQDHEFFGYRQSI